jgi:phosphoserine phosphatase RsbU/P
MLVAYTDGMVEPENAYGEMFGEERLTDLLVKYSRARFLRDHRARHGGRPAVDRLAELQDDMTMVVARRI